MNTKETGELLTFIQGAFPGRFEVNKNTVKVWQDMLHDQHFEGVMLRARKHIERSSHPPQISDLKVKRYPVIG